MEFRDFVRHGATINRNNSDVMLSLRIIWEGLGAQRCGSHHSDDVEVMILYLLEQFFYLESCTRNLTIQ